GGPVGHGGGRWRAVVVPGDQHRLRGAGLPGNRDGGVVELPGIGLVARAPAAGLVVVFRGEEAPQRPHVVLGGVGDLLLPPGVELVRPVVVGRQVVHIGGAAWRAVSYGDPADELGGGVVELVVAR